jgi:hypothetical protein
LCQTRKTPTLATAHAWHGANIYIDTTSKKSISGELFAASIPYHQI